MKNPVKKLKLMGVAILLAFSATAHAANASAAPPSLFQADKTLAQAQAVSIDELQNIFGGQQSVAAAVEAPDRVLTARLSNGQVAMITVAAASVLIGSVGIDFLPLTVRRESLLDGVQYYATESLSTFPTLIWAGSIIKAYNQSPRAAADGRGPDLVDYAHIAATGFVRAVSFYGVQGLVNTLRDIGRTTVNDAGFDEAERRAAPMRRLLADEVESLFDQRSARLTDDRRRLLVDHDIFLNDTSKAMQTNMRNIEAKQDEVRNCVLRNCIKVNRQRLQSEVANLYGNLTEKVTDIVKFNDNFLFPGQSELTSRDIGARIRNQEMQDRLRYQIVIDNRRDELR